jgi:prepilin-type processing-associated H-X9-DG protein
MIMYTQDYDERFPQERIPNVYNPPAPNGYTWRYAVMPYIKSVGVWQCPDQSPDWAEGYLDQQAGIKRSYALNGEIFDNSNSLMLSQIHRSGSVIMLLESMAEYPDLGTWCYPWNWNPGPFRTHSNAMSNWAFFDGHVKFLTHQAVAGSGNSSAWHDEEPPNGDPNWINNLLATINAVPQFQ